MSAASSISSVAARTTRPSAGTRLPASTSTMSPGTSSLGVDLDRLAVAAHPGDRLHHLRERLDALLGLGLLAQADHGVEDGEPGQHDRGAGVPGDELVDEGGAEQDELHEVLVLAQERAPGRAPACRRPAGSGRARRAGTRLARPRARWRGRRRGRGRDRLGRDRATGSTTVGAAVAGDGVSVVIGRLHRAGAWSRRTSIVGRARVVAPHPARGGRAANHPRPRGDAWTARARGEFGSTAGQPSRRTR